MTVVTVGVLFALKIQGAIIIGVISGFLNLIPFVGLLLASVLPLMAATLQFNTATPFIVILVTVVGLHLISANLLIPKFIGSRVSVGPVAATMGMLFLGMAMGSDRASAGCASNRVRKARRRLQPFLAAYLQSLGGDAPFTRSLGESCKPKTAWWVYSFDRKKVNDRRGLTVLSGRFHRQQI